MTCSFYFSIVDMDKIEPRMLWFSHKQKIKIAQIFNQFQLLMFNFLVFVCAVLRIGQQKFSLILSLFALRVHFRDLMPIIFISIFCIFLHGRHCWVLVWSYIFIHYPLHLRLPSLVVLCIPFNKKKRGGGGGLVFSQGKSHLLLKEN